MASTSTRSSAKSDARDNPCISEDQETEEQTICLQQLRDAITASLTCTGEQDVSDSDDPEAQSVALITEPWRSDADLQAAHLLLEDALNRSERTSVLNRPKLSLPSGLLPLLP